MYGAGVSVRRASSSTAPTSASSSVARPASMSCSIEVLWAPTRAAPSMRRSSGTRSAMPSLPATACASRIDAPARVRAAVALEVPPRDAVLHRQHDALIVQHAAQLGYDRRELVRLHGEHHQVRWAGIGHALEDGEPLPARAAVALDKREPLAT